MLRNIKKTHLWFIPHQLCLIIQIRISRCAFSSEICFQLTFTWNEELFKITVICAQHNTTMNILLLGYFSFILFWYLFGFDSLDEIYKRREKKSNCEMNKPFVVDHWHNPLLIDTQLSIYRWLFPTNSHLIRI